MMGEVGQDQTKRTRGAMTETNTIMKLGHMSQTAVWIVGQDAEGAQDSVVPRTAIVSGA